MPITPIGIAAAGPVASIVSKATVEWLKSQFLSYNKNRKQSASDQKHWDEVVGKIVGQTQLMAERFSRITTVAFPNHPVDLEAIYEPVTLEKPESGESFLVDGYPSSLLSIEKKIILIDEAGMGKSTLSRILFIRAINGRAQLPILIDLRRLTRANKIDDVLADQFGILVAQRAAFLDLLFSKPIIYIFDGFDEVADNEKAEVSRLIRYFVDRAPNANFVITSRPELMFSDYTDFKQFKIRGLTADDAFSLINRYGSAFAAEECAKALIDDLRAKRDEAVHSFLQNPLLASLLFRTYDYRSVVPVKRALFYKQVFEALYEAHDLNKETAYVRNKRTGLHQDDFHGVLRAIASQFRQRKVTEVGSSEFLDIARNISKSQCEELKFSAEGLLHDVTHAVPIFSKDGDKVRWAHKSLLDYFLSEFLLRDYSRSKEEALAKLSFGRQSFSNENLLILIQESDPVLFAKSVTIPALRAVLTRYGEIFKSLPKEIEEAEAVDIANFCAFYEATFAPKSDWRPAELFAEHTSDAAKYAHVSSAEFILSVMYHLGDRGGNIGIFINVNAAALAVPIKTGTLPSLRIYNIARKYGGGGVDVERSASNKIRSFIGSRSSTDDYSTIEEDFVSLMNLVGRSQLELASPDQMLKTLASLDHSVEATMKARSDEIF